MAWHARSIFLTIGWQPRLPAKRCASTPPPLPPPPACYHARVMQRLHSAPAAMPSGGDREVTLLDYGAGNVRSVRNAIRKLGYSIKEASGAAVGWLLCGTVVGLGLATTSGWPAAVDGSHNFVTVCRRGFFIQQAWTSREQPLLLPPQ